MAGPPPPPPPSGDDDDIMGTYADAITLLMAFFVLFFSISKVDLDVMDEVAKGMSSAISKEERETKQETLKKNIKDVVYSEGAEEVVKIASDAQGSITLELDGGAFFKAASAELMEQAIPVLEGIFQEINSDLYLNFNIIAEGHTDDDPISTPRYPSNWELSSNRASTVVRFFISNGMKKNRLRAIGYADTQPKLPNRDASGAPIPDNMIANRRIILRINRQPIYEEIRLPKFRRKEGDKKSNKTQIN